MILNVFEAMVASCALTEKRASSGLNWNEHIYEIFHAKLCGLPIIHLQHEPNY